MSNPDESSMHQEALAGAAAHNSAPKIWLGVSDLGWARSGVANGIGQFSFIKREGYTIPFMPVAPVNAQDADVVRPEDAEQSDAGVLDAESRPSLLNSCPNPIHEFSLFGRKWYWQLAEDHWATEERNGCIASDIISLRYITPAERDVALYALTVGRLFVMTAAKPKVTKTAGSSAK